MVDILKVSGLSVETAQGERLLRDVSFALAPGERCGLIGASGCGKSLTAAALCGLLRPPLSVTGGTATLEGVELFSLSPKMWRKQRRGAIFQTFQSPGSALTPTLRLGPQLTEAARISGADPRRVVPEALKIVGLPADTVRQFPYQLSGGMKQRSLIAMALILRPRVLIADEPTTGLDILTERDILRALDAMIEATGAALLFISHDLRAVRAIAPRTLVMAAGAIVEDCATDALENASHPAAQRLGQAAAELEAPC
ncbi:MAG: ABC transporter ATP-binding protein [Marinosulfonomonas sp.]|nr:ABC transporter ATP-binding protein [Marinosulfonomonas sp.]